MKKSDKFKIIFGHKNYNSVFIHCHNIKKTVNNIFKELSEPSIQNDFQVVLPNILELENQDPIFYVQKYSPILKKHLSGPSTKTLVIDETILNCIVKNDKKNNFFKFLFKQNKKIIVFCENDFSNFLQDISPNYLYSKITQEEWEERLKIFDKINDIKETTTITINVFKNPFHPIEL